MPITARLETARRDLLDLTTRSRLIHTPRGARVKIVEVVDELSDEVFRILVRDGKTMSFLPRPEPPEPATHPEDRPPSTPGTPVEGPDAPDSDVGSAGPDDAWNALPQPDDDVDETGRARRHIDTRLQTIMPSAQLQRRLLQLHYDARSFEEEQGISILYLALGFLKWFEAESSDKPRYAPLILVPVTLDRRSARARFQLAYGGEELFTNLSLQAKLEQDFGIKMPDLPDQEDLSPGEYCAAVREVIAGMPRWEVRTDDIVLGFFSFAKFLMYRDLDPENWPDRQRIDEHELIRGLLSDGWRDEGSPFSEDPNIDEILEPENMIHVVDADSSQTLAIEEVRRGRNLVIQGPPGTGKSQTIANLIAAAIRDGKKVLFMAEKMAALEVVKRRLDEIGVGVACLELHSHKARKKALLEELERTLMLGRPRTEGADDVLRELRARRQELNDYVKRIHGPIEPAGYTPYRVAGHLVRLAARGIAPQDYRFEDALGWTRNVLKERAQHVHGLARHIEEMGTPAEHPWRGVELDAVLPQDVHRLEAQVATAAASVTAWDASVADFARRLGAPAETLAQVRRLLNLGTAIARLPAGTDRAALDSEPWDQARDAISELVDSGRTLARARAELEGVMLPEAWNEDLAAVRRTLNAHGNSMFRFLNAEYRKASQQFQSFLVGRPPREVSTRIGMLDTLARGQRARARILDQDAFGRAAFGSLWQAERSDWDRFAAVDEWERACRSEDLPDGFRLLVARLESADGIEDETKRLRSSTEDVAAKLAALLEALCLSIPRAFGREGLEDVVLAELTARLEAWQSAPSGLQQWIVYRTRAAEARRIGLDDVVARLYDARIEPASAVHAFHKIYFEELMREAFRRHPQLATFSGTAHDHVIREFRRLDEERIRVARLEVAAAHFAGMPSGNAEVGEMAVLRREFRRQRRHLPLRQLLKQAGTAIQAIKPVFMMSPMSIAQYLEPGVLRYDLLLIDEASQVQPVEALGAIARADQIVVVGDDRQLPPTRFFQRVLGEDPATDDPEEFGIADLESILGLCAAQGIGSRMLRWHYRSRHESLIAVSNREFYDEKLFIVPSAERTRQLGLHFHYIEGGIYDRGGSATNRVEAQSVARAVLEHADKHPDRTLGVGTFSVSQRDAILDELELLRREHPETEAFFGTSGPEPFFVKNLESIQGDERDVIFISVGYGKDASGYMAMSFGPLSSEGGERRLNVLITRARERCEVFSSISYADIDLNRGRSRGVAAFKTFLQYAETGYIELAEPSGRDPESPFEEEVGNALRQLGYEVEHEVGVAGFFIDIGIRDPERPGRYIIGIECDGARYHSSRSARDRDRLREQVLRDRNWTIYRIWSTDWFHRPKDELRKAVEAIERARARDTGYVEPPHAAGGPTEPSTDEAGNSDAAGSPVGSQADPPLQAVPAAHPEIPRENVDDSEPGLETPGGAPYREADFTVSSPVEPHAAPMNVLIDTVVRIVEVEGPIHSQEVGRRLATVWGRNRAGNRIQEAAARALWNALDQGRIARDGKFFSLEPLETMPPRDRSAVRSTTLRRPDMLPPVEIRTAIGQVVAAGVGVTPDEAVTQAVRLFGFQRTGADLRAAIEAEIRRMLAQEQLALRDGKLYLT